MKRISRRLYGVSANLLCENALVTHLNWDDIRFLLELSRSGSLSAAARALDVEHTTVSRRITHLERDLQTKLFNRMARGWVATPEGQQLADRAAKLESEMLSLSRIARQGSGLEGTVRVSIPPFLLSEIIVPVLPDFVQRYPKIALELVGETRSADLTRSEADIALRMTDSDAAELVTRTTCRITYGLFGVEKWQTVPAEERKYIGFPNKSAIWQSTQLDNVTGGDKYVFRTNFFGAMLNAALRGMGIALLPEFIAIHHPSLIRFSGLERTPTAPVILVMQRDIRHSPRVRAVADFLVSALGSKTI